MFSRSSCAQVERVAIIIGANNVGSEYWFRIVKESYLEANGKKYKLTAADGITLDENNYTTVKATDSTEDFLSKLSYIDFTLTFEPFDIIPDTFDFKEGDGQGAFVIRITHRS